MFQFGLKNFIPKYKCIGGKNKKLRSHIVQKRISICDDDFSLNFSREEPKVEAPIHFKRRNRTIRYKLQTMMNQMHNKFFNTIININPSF